MSMPYTMADVIVAGCKQKLKNLCDTPACLQATHDHQSSSALPTSGGVTAFQEACAACVHTAASRFPDSWDPGGVGSSLADSCKSFSWAAADSRADVCTARGCRRRACRVAYENMVKPSMASVDPTTILSTGVHPQRHAMTQVPAHLW